MLSLVALPAASTYMLRVAASGARSRKSMKVVRPSAMRSSINPPPPRLPAPGCVTASAKPTATAASTAFPPACRTLSPAAVACGSTVTTMPCRARTGCAAQTGIAAANRNSDSVRRIELDFTALPLQTSPSPFEQYHAGRHRHVQRRDLARHGNAHQHVAMLADLFVQPFAFTAQHQDRRQGI